MSCNEKNTCPCCLCTDLKSCRKGDVIFFVPADEESSSCQEECDKECSSDETVKESLEELRNWTVKESLEELRKWCESLEKGNCVGGRGVNETYGQCPSSEDYSSDECSSDCSKEKICGGPPISFNKKDIGTFRSETQTLLSELNRQEECIKLINVVLEELIQSLDGVTKGSLDLVEVDSQQCDGKEPILIRRLESYNDELQDIATVINEIKDSLQIE